MHEASWRFCAIGAAKVSARIRLLGGVRRRRRLALTVLGTLASLAANRHIAGQLFGVTPHDPIAIVVAQALLAIVTMVAGYFLNAMKITLIR